MEVRKILEIYGMNDPALTVASFGSGLINNTWKVDNGGEAYILQRVNDNVFKVPEDIAHNTRRIGNYLGERYPGYLFVRSLLTQYKTDLHFVEGSGYFRLVPFIKNSHTVDVVQTPLQAFEAAKQFGKFTYLLRDFPVNELRVTIPDFHNLTLRYAQFLQALQNGNPERITEAAGEIAWLKEKDFIVQRFDAMKANPAFKQRVTHHDTKISNVLFNNEGKGLCVIDLDTVMPGYFISDVGDMMRTCLSPVSEEEKDFSLIQIRDNYFVAIVKGYLEGMNGELSEPEMESFFDAGCYLMYMQALRFLSDHLNNDVYYGARYEGHNYMRACNQIKLLEKMLEKEAHFRTIR